MVSAGAKAAMSDLADKAAVQEAQFLADALAKHQLPPGSESRSICVDCGGAIPEERQKAVPGCVRCIGCQLYQEIGFP